MIRRFRRVVLQSTRAPEEEKRGYGESSKHLLGERSKKPASFSALVLWCSVVLRFNFSVLSEEIATRTKGKNAGEGLNHRGHRGHRERHSDFPLCPLCPLWLDFSDRSLRLGSGYAGLGSIDGCIEVHRAGGGIHLPRARMKTRWPDVAMVLGCYPWRYRP